MGFSSGSRQSINECGGTSHRLPSWRQFKEAFAPELVEVAVSETAASLGRSVTTCLDPFGGSGTTALTCQFLGVFPTTIEVNPFLADLISAKLGRYNFELLPTLLRKITNARVRTKFACGAFPGAAATFVEPGHKGRFIFPRDVAERLHLFSLCLQRYRSLFVFLFCIGKFALRFCKGYSRRLQGPISVSRPSF